MPRWTHETTVEVQTTPVDVEDVSVRLHLTGSPATKEYFDRAYGNWLPGDPPEVEVIRVEVFDGSKYRRAIPADPYGGDSHDQPILDAVEDWWDERSAECWDSLEEDE